MPLCSNKTLFEKQAADCNWLAGCSVLILGPHYSFLQLQSFYTIKINEMNAGCGGR